MTDKEKAMAALRNELGKTEAVDTALLEVGETFGKLVDVVLGIKSNLESSGFTPEQAATLATTMFVLGATPKKR